MENSWCHETHLPNKNSEDHGECQPDQNGGTLDAPMGDLCSRAMVAQGIEHFVSNTTPVGACLVRPLGLQLFINAAHTNLFGAPVLTPIQCMLAAHITRTRRQTESAFALAHMSPMKAFLLASAAPWRKLRQVNFSERAAKS